MTALGLLDRLTQNSSFLHASYPSFASHTCLTIQRNHRRSERATPIRGYGCVPRYLSHRAKPHLQRVRGF